MRYYARFCGRTMDRPHQMHKYGCICDMNCAAFGYDEARKEYVCARGAMRRPT